MHDNKRKMISENANNADAKIIKEMSHSFNKSVTNSGVQDEIILNITSFCRQFVEKNRFLLLFWRFSSCVSPGGLWSGDV